MLWFIIKSSLGEGAHNTILNCWSHTWIHGMWQLYFTNMYSE